MSLDFAQSFHGDPSLLDEIGDTGSLGDSAVFGGTCSFMSIVAWDPWHIHPLSNALGNRGSWCTLTKECQGNCQGG